MVDAKHRRPAAACVQGPGEFLHGGFHAGASPPGGARAMLVLLAHEPQPGVEHLRLRHHRAQHPGRGDDHGVHPHARHEHVLHARLPRAAHLPRLPDAAHHAVLQRREGHGVGHRELPAIPGLGPPAPRVPHVHDGGVPDAGGEGRAPQPADRAGRRRQPRRDQPAGVLREHAEDDLHPVPLHLRRHRLGRRRGAPERDQLEPRRHPLPLRRLRRLLRPECHHRGLRGQRHEADAARRRKPATGRAREEEAVAQGRAGPVPEGRRRLGGGEDGDVPGAHRGRRSARRLFQDRHRCERGARGQSVQDARLRRQRRG
mmetsp:Transcript_67055/g.188873  ORF Transcript_67055/g.188873 Transcript_67055/m.188873 type:complete len:315 (-) Transcript_67055:328-1272(-)